MRERIIDFLSEFGVPKTKFCQRIGICTQTLTKILNGDAVSDQTVSKIENYLRRYGR